MKRGFLFALLVASYLTVSLRAHAQAAPSQNPPPANTQKPPAKPAPAQDPNAFPEDTTSVPVMPSKGTPALPPGTYTGDDNAADSRRLPLPASDGDPVRSPDDAASESDNAQELQSSSSSSRAGLDKLLPDTGDDDQPQGKHRKQAAKPPDHVETSAEDIEVGKYYLQTKNWKAAISRFQSAMVLSPDDPDVYWGLAESDRNLGRLAEARIYYQKVAEYDPDSKHGKEALKFLKDPQIANAKATPSTPPTP